MYLCTAPVWRAGRSTLWTVKLGLAQARHSAPGVIDYRLARQSVLDRFARGEVARSEVCDAHTELRRNAEFCGDVIDGPCPVCALAPLHNVVYVFGPRLPSGGRCVTSRLEMERLGRRKGEYRAYAVEVCLACGWNHLVHSWFLASSAA